MFQFYLIKKQHSTSGQDAWLSQQVGRTARNHLVLGLGRTKGANVTCVLEARSFVDYLGEVGGREREEALADARALLFPIDWPEPFGLAMIEALACGTPVIAFRRGSVPEVLEDGVSGFVVDGIDEAVRAVGRVGELSRRCCRLAFERRFTAARMAGDYLAIYEDLLAGRGG